jgi:hypothetical protein
MGGKAERAATDEEEAESMQKFCLFSRSRVEGEKMVFALNERIVSMIYCS